MTEHPMTIGGQAVAGPGFFDVVNPATGEPFGRAPDCTREQLDAAMAAAASAFPAWAADAEARRAALLQAADALQAAADEVADVLSAEQGKPRAEAGREVLGATAWLRAYANYREEPEILQDNEQATVKVVRRPLGVIAVITPWNFPALIPVQQLAPALAAGNTVVLKPSPYTPLTALVLGRVLNQVLPAGVLNIVAGGDDLGAWMTSHPVPRKISFTGSIPTGKLVAKAAADDLKRVTLEMGGNDAAIVLDDVQVSDIAERLFWNAFYNNGQICIAIKRLFVPEAQYDQAVSALADIAKSVRVGDPSAPDTQLGPINNRPQYERVQELTAEALHKGAVAAAGGSPIDSAGYFYSPTVLAGAGEGMRVVDEEQFGPVLPVLPYRDLDEAVTRANATHYGLGGSVWTSDPERGEQVATRLDTGDAWVNNHLAVTPFHPIGGAKWSGIGVVFGRDGFHGLQQAQTVYTQKG